MIRHVSATDKKTEQESIKNNIPNSMVHNEPNKHQEVLKGVYVHLFNNLITVYDYWTNFNRVQGSSM